MIKCEPSRRIAFEIETETWDIVQRSKFDAIIAMQPKLDLSKPLFLFLFSPELPLTVFNITNRSYWLGP